MEFEREQQNGITLLKPKGRIDTVSSRTFEEALAALIDKEHCKKLIISLEHIEYISSAGLRVFLITGKKLKGPGGGLVLCCMAERILDVFRMSGFDKIIKITTTVEDAKKVFA
ncbi:MAG: STAS domain-containing protein [Holosporales bacterium]|jgi:anti-anti-sigma factor|nr:STAS domain-containing protein [Holosporales bacterium]